MGDGGVSWFENYTTARKFVVIWNLLLLPFVGLLIALNWRMLLEDLGFLLLIPLGAAVIAFPVIWYLTRRGGPIDFDL